MKLTTAVEI